MNTQFSNNRKTDSCSSCVSNDVKKISSGVVKLAILTIAFVTVMGFGVSNAAFAAVLNVEIDTTSFSGSNALLAFDFIDGDSVINNTVTVDNFAIDGALGATSAVGDVTGTLPGIVTLGDSTFFNELLQGITFGQSLQFTLELTENNAGGSPDQFSFFT